MNYDLCTRSLLQFSPFFTQGLKTAKRDLVVNARGIFLCGREKANNKNSKNNDSNAGEVVITRHITFDQLSHISLSSRQDDFVVLHVFNSYDTLLQVPFKTEMVSATKRVAEARGKDLRVAFADK
jgi:myosin-1